MAMPLTSTKFHGFLCHKTHNVFLGFEPNLEFKLRIYPFAIHTDITIIITRYYNIETKPLTVENFRGN
jgi:hypothetical protein